MKHISRSVTHWWTQKYRCYLLAALAVMCINAGVAFTWAVPKVISPDTASSWAVDTIAPVPPLTEAYHRFTRAGTDPVVYPLFHYLVLSGVYAPYIGAQYLAGGLRNPSAAFPYGIADPVSFFRDLSVLAHAVSLLMALGIVALTFVITERVFSARAAAWSALIVALLAPLAYYAKTSNLDVPYLFWTLLAVWEYLQVVRYQRPRDYIALGVCIALAVATKDQSYGFFILLPLMLAVALARHRTGSHANGRAVALALISPPMWLVGVSAGVTFAVANNLIFGWDGFIRHIAFIRAFFEENLQPGDPQRHTAVSQAVQLWQSFQLLAEMYGYLTAALCLVGIGFAYRRRQWLALSLLLFPVAYYASVLAVAGVVVSRYILGPALLLAPFAGAAVDRLLQGPPAMRRAGLAIAVGTLLWQLLLSIHLDMVLLRDSRYPMEAWIRANVPPGSTIESQIQQRYLPRLGDDYRLSIVGNSMDPVTYKVLPGELNSKKLRLRNPDYILILRDIGVTGDPERMTDPQLQDYYRKLLRGEIGYRVIAQFETPNFLPYRQVTAGTQPTAILLARHAPERGS